MDRRTEIRVLGDELRDEFRLAVAGLRDGSLPQRVDELSDAVDAAASAGSGGMEADSVPEAPEGDPPAFTVRWDPTLSDGDGGWAVYLPTEHLLSYDGIEVATSDISGVTVVEDGDGNDTPWYSLDEVGADAEHVWLVLTVPDSGPVEAEFAEEEGQAASGEEVVNVCVAEIVRDMEDSAGNPVPVVRQSLSGALHLGSGGGGGGSVTPDDVSTDLRDNGDTTNDGKLQIKDWDHATPPGATTTMAEDLVASQSADKTVARQGDKALKYKASGRFYAESDTNIVFTSDNAGGIKIGVYYA